MTWTKLCRQLLSGLLPLQVFCAGCGSDNPGEFTAGFGGAAGARSANGGTPWGGAPVNSTSQQGGSVTAAGGAAVGGNACPVWPIQKLLPFIGPQFYGPDPGPCSIESVYADGRVELSTLDYSPDGSLLRTSGALNAIFTYDAQGRPTGSTLAVYEYGEGFALATTKGMTSHHRYNLDGLGYVTTALEIDTASGAVRRIYTYSYTNCRPSKVTYSEGSGDVVYYSDIVFDGEGRIVRRSGPSITSTFDYSCWQ